MSLCRMACQQPANSRIKQSINICANTDPHELLVVVMNRTLAHRELVGLNPAVTYKPTPTTAATNVARTAGLVVGVCRTQADVVDAHHGGAVGTLRVHLEVGSCNPGRPNLFIPLRDGCWVLLAHDLATGQAGV